MQILTYLNTAQDAPAQQRAVALIFHANLGKMHPVMITGSDEDEARRKAQAFWDTESERLNRRDGRTKEGRAQSVTQEEIDAMLQALDSGTIKREDIDLRTKEGRILKAALAQREGEQPEPELMEAVG